MAKAVYWKGWESTRAKVLWTGQLSQADPSMVKVQVSSHNQCVWGGGGGCMWPGKTKGSGDRDREEHIRVHLNIERQQFSQPTKEMTNTRPRGLWIWYNWFCHQGYHFFKPFVSDLTQGWAKIGHYPISARKTWWLDFPCERSDTKRSFKKNNFLMINSWDISTNVLQVLQNSQTSDSLHII
jgi:hypothetical protein